MAVLRDEYLNPFEVDLDKSTLFNLSSATPIPQNIAEEVLSLPSKGKALAGDFLNKRILTIEVPFNNPIKRNINKTKLTSKKETKLCRGNKIKSVEINRNILGKLVSYSAISGKVVDYSAALKYPLSPIPLSICHPEWS